MRARRTAQTSLFEPRAVDHPVADDLQRASDWLDDHPELLELVAADVGGDATTGRHGLTCETILRCAVLKHLWRHSYRELEFLLRDSASAQRFARVEAHRAPGKTALQAAVAAVGAATWEADRRRAAGVGPRGRRGGRAPGARRQHGHRDAHPGAGGQPAAVRRGAGADAAARRGARAAGAGGGGVPGPRPGGEAARPGDPLGTGRRPARRAVPAAAGPGSAHARLRRSGAAGGGGGARAVGAFLDGGGGRTRRTRGAGRRPDPAAGAPTARPCRLRREGREPVRAAHRHRPSRAVGGRTTDTR